MHLVVSRTGSNHRRRVVYGYSRPHAELLHRHAKCVADSGEEEQCNAVEHEHHAQRYRHALCLSTYDRTYRCYRRTAADGCARREQVARLCVYAQQLSAQQPSERQCSEHTGYGEHHSFCARSERLVDVHAEAESDN